MWPFLCDMRDEGKVLALVKEGRLNRCDGYIYALDWPISLYNEHVFLQKNTCRFYLNTYVSSILWVKIIMKSRL